MTKLWEKKKLSTSRKKVFTNWPAEWEITYFLSMSENQNRNELYQGGPVNSWNKTVENKSRGEDVLIVIYKADEELQRVFELLNWPNDWKTCGTCVRKLFTIAWDKNGCFLMDDHLIVPKKLWTVFQRFFNWVPRLLANNARSSRFLATIESPWPHVLWFCVETCQELVEAGQSFTSIKS